MGGVLVCMVVGLITVLIGCAVGYAFAAFRFGNELQAAGSEKQELQRQLARSLAGTLTALPTKSEPEPAAGEPLEEAFPVVLVPSPALLLPPDDLLDPTDAVDDSLTAEANPAATAVDADATPVAPEEVSSGATQNWQQLIAESASRAQSDVLCMVDIDFLRQYREQYGQKLSDYVSQHVEHVVRDTLQHHDAVISRYEGQELVIVWPAAVGAASRRLHEARSTAALIRKNVEQAFLQIGEERLTVTASIGLALCEAGLPGEHVIARADEALAGAKKAGRNRAFFHDGEKCLPAEPLTPHVSADEKDAKRSATPPKKTFRLGGQRERRRHERKPCSNINLIAPCTDNQLPSIEVFQRVQFFDISSSGFSMIVPSVPTTNQFAVALINNKGMIFMAAEVANVRQAKRTNKYDKPLLIVGCRFRQRLYPQAVAESPSKSSITKLLALT